jgi:hypothetical protein
MCLSYLVQALTSYSLPGTVVSEEGGHIVFCYMKSLRLFRLDNKVSFSYYRWSSCRALSALKKIVRSVFIISNTHVLKVLGAAGADTVRLTATHRTVFQPCSYGAVRRGHVRLKPDSFPKD